MPTNRKQRLGHDISRSHIGINSLKHYKSKGYVHQRKMYFKLFLNDT